MHLCRRLDGPLGRAGWTAVWLKGIGGTGINPRSRGWAAVRAHIPSAIHRAYLEGIAAAHLAGEPGTARISRRTAQPAARNAVFDHQQVEVVQPRDGITAAPLYQEARAVLRSGKRGDSCRGRRAVEHQRPGARLSGIAGPVPGRYQDNHVRLIGDAGGIPIHSPAVRAVQVPAQAAPGPTAARIIPDQKLRMCNARAAVRDICPQRNDRCGQVTAGRSDARLRSCPIHGDLHHRLGANRAAVHSHLPAAGVSAIRRGSGHAQAVQRIKAVILPGAPEAAHRLGRDGVHLTAVDKSQAVTAGWVEVTGRYPRLDYRIDNRAWAGNVRGRRYNPHAHRAG